MVEWPSLETRDEALDLAQRRDHAHLLHEAEGVQVEPPLYSLARYHLPSESSVRLSSEKGIALSAFLGYNLGGARCHVMLRYPAANKQRTHCEGKGATAMSDIPNDDKPGFVAEKPEHCFACYRLIQPGETPADENTRPAHERSMRDNGPSRQVPVAAEREAGGFGRLAARSGQPIDDTQDTAGF